MLVSLYNSLLNKKWTDQVFIIAIASLFYLPFLGGLHLFDWDEINFAEMAREMLLTKDYMHLQVNFKPFYEKPPFFIWLQAFSMYLFGVNEYAARLPNAMCGILTHLIIYQIGTTVYNRRFGLLWTIIYAGSILPHWYFKSGIIDPWFNLFIFLGIYFLIKLSWNKNFGAGTLKQSNVKYIFIAALFTGLAILTKGPVAFVITILVVAVYWVYSKFSFFISPISFLVYALSAFAVVGVWLSVEIVQNGFLFVNEFLIRNYELLIQPDAGHKGFLGYHFVVFILGGFPASIFCIRAMWSVKSEQTVQQKDFRVWMMILFLVVIILFSFVTTKIIHYSSLTYLPLTFLAALCIDNLIKQKIVFVKWLYISLLIIGIILAAVLIGVPFIGKNISLVIPYVKDEFAQENMKALVVWNGAESLVGVFFIAIICFGIFKFKNNKIQEGVIWLFCGTAITVQLIMYVFLNNIEQYSQRAAVDFYKNLRNKDCYAINVNYKSYAQLFYFDKQIPLNPLALNEDWLLTGDIDKEVYIVTKINELEDVKSKVADAEEIYRKNGFIFLRRVPKAVSLK